VPPGATAVDDSRTHCGTVWDGIGRGWGTGRADIELHADIQMNFFMDDDRAG
jgi:hypothetical protein